MRPSSVVRVCGALVLAACCTSPVFAGVPDPSTSDCSTCLVLSPGGDFLYRVVVRDDASAPISGATVTIDFTAAVGINLCTESDPDGDRKVSGVTDAAGVVDFRIRGGGTAVADASVSSQGQTLCFPRPRSPDLNGDLTVAADDFSAHAALPSNSPAGDYDCDGDTDAADNLEVENRLGHNCSTVPVAESTWGRLKAHYR